MKQLSVNGLKLIKQFEGLRLTAYKAVATEKYYTIGYGHYGPDVKKDQHISTMGAEMLLLEDIRRFVAHVNQYDKIYRFNQNQFDALVSFAYNIGSITQLTKNGTRTKEQIADALLLYNKSGKKTLPGLVKRRAAERALYVR